MTIVNIHEAKTHFSKLLMRAHAGEEIIIAKSGEPYAKLTPLTPMKERKPGIAQGSVDDAFFEPLPNEILDDWEQQ